MKLLQITNRFPWPLKDGGALGYYNFTKGYHDAGVELTLASLNTSKHFVKLEELPQEVLALADIHLSYIDNHVKPWPAFLNLFSKRSYHVERFLSNEFEALLAKLCDEKQPDVVVFESIFVAPYLDVVRQHTKAICILREHNIEYRIWETLAALERNPAKRWYLNLLAGRLKDFELKVLNEFDGISAITSTEKDQLRKAGIHVPMDVFPFGIHTEQLKPDHKQMEVPSVFHLGSMDWMPNQEAMKWFIDQVWSKVHEQMPELRFYLAGRNIPSWFFNYHQDQQVLVVGEVEDAIAFMHSKAIMIVPLFSGSGIRVKILEGMALGKCIISTTLGAQGIDATDGEHILIADDAATFVEKIKFLVQHPEEVTRIGNNAAKLAAEVYDNKKIIDRLLHFYAGLIHAHHTYC